MDTIFPSITLDGNDVVALNQASRTAVEMCRRGGGPVFIEAVTYRWRGHVGPREDVDVGVSRAADLGKMEKTRSNCPPSPGHGGRQNFWIQITWIRFGNSTVLKWKKHGKRLQMRRSRLTTSY